MSVEYDAELAKHNLKLLGKFLKEHTAEFTELNTLYTYANVLGKPSDFETLRLSLLTYATIKLRKRFEDMTVKDLAAFLEAKERASLKKRGRPLKNNTKAAALRVCVSFLRSLGVDVSYKELRKLMPSWNTKFEAVFYVDLTEDEVQRIKACMPTLEGRLAVELQAHSGLRPVEALGLRWGDLFEASTKDGKHILYARIVHRPGEYGAKGRKGERTVPLSSEAVSLIEAIARERRVRGYRDPAYRNECIILMTYREYLVMFKKAVKKAGIPPKPHPVNPHILRHFFAIEYLRRGGSPSTLRSIMGINIDTLQRYIEVAGRDVSAEYASIFC